MSDIEKVIEATEICGGFCSVVDGCPYYCFKDYMSSRCRAKLKRDIIDLLKTLVPRLMTLEEIWDRGDDEPLFLEYTLPTKSVLRPAIFQPDNSDEGGGDGYMCVVSAWCASGFYNRKEYGKTWRCWTSRPTDEQREAAPWDGQTQ